MSSFCDECGATFVKPTSNFCSDCGTKRCSELVQDVAIIPADVMGGNVDVDAQVEEEEQELPLWVLNDRPGLTLQKKIYGRRPAGLPKSVAWGRKFLKEHHCYKKQYKKLLWNQQIVRDWFRVGTDGFVDGFLSSSSLHWNKEYVRSLHKYVRDRCRRAKELREDNIVDLHFPTEGITVHWEMKDIVQYLYEHKKYRKSPKSVQRRNLPAIEGTQNDPVPIRGQEASETAKVLACVVTSISIQDLEHIQGPEQGPSTSRPDRRRRVPSKLRE
jgi:hypothetical protein